jgi:putative ABC transport system permease protein
LNRLAINILLGDRARYFGIVLGVSVAAFLISQQLAMLNGILDRITATIRNLGQVEIWVVDPNVQFADDAKPMADSQLARVRGIEGVAWAVPLYKGNLRVRLEDGNFQMAILNGLDDATLIGGPPEMLAGKLSDLRESDAVIVDQAGATGKLARRGADGKRIPLAVGSTLEINERRAIVVGICKAAQTFQSNPVIYTTYSRAGYYAPQERKRLTFILAKAREGSSAADVAARIGRISGLGAYTNKEFRDMTQQYFIRETGIVTTFVFGILISFAVGTMIAGQTFYNFTLENLRQFGAIKAMGASNSRILGMIGMQAALVGTIGLGLGVGLAALLAWTARDSEMSMRFSTLQLGITAAAVFCITMIAAWLGARRVISLDPAVVFKG